MSSREELAAQIGDRRRHRRRSTKGKVTVRVEPIEIAGDIDNLSRSGLLCFVQGDLRVRVEIENNGAVTQRSGRVVRAQRMRENTTGLAIEFDA